MMRSPFFLCSVLLVLSLMAQPVRADSYSGTWSAQANNSTNVHLRLEYRHADASGNEEWDESHDVPISQLHGLSASDFTSSGEHKSFSIVRDAGTMRADGWFAGGNGSGSWTLVPNPSFASALARRGVGAPSQKQQFQLAMGDFKLSTLDQLLNSGFQRPSIDDLVAMSEHGVTDEYIAAVRNVPMRPKTVHELIRMRDHGVDAEYAAQMLSRDRNLTSEDVIELRDHGVSADFMKSIVANGYGSVTPQQAERLRDHGVSAEYLSGLRALGYHPSVDDLVRLVDHGVSISFIQKMRSHGYAHLSADDLIRLRDHGF